MDGQNFNNDFSQQQTPQAPEQPNYQQPMYQQPNYQQPMYQQPDYQQPGYQQSPYQQMPEQPVYQQPYAVPVQSTNSTSGLSIAGFVIGIVALVSSCILSWISVLIGLVGLILAIVGQVKKKSGMGVAAIIVSAIGIVLGIVFFCVYMYVIVNDPSYYRYF